MSSGASVNALQRLVEQLKLEAGVERIKVRRAAAPFGQGAGTSLPPCGGRRRPGAVRGEAGCLSLRLGRDGGREDGGPAPARCCGSAGTRA